MLSNVANPLFAQNQTGGGTNQTGIANQTEIENLTGTTFGNITASPNATTLEGLEKSQMGNVIPGQQDTAFEGQNISAQQGGKQQQNQTQ